MDMSYEETNNNDTRFNVKHYRVRFEKRRENPIRFVVNVLSYAVFIFLMLVGATLLIYVADIKLREAKGDFSQPKFNAYVVLTGSMLPTIQIKDIVVTKKVSDDKLKVGDIITFLTPDQRFNGISITHRIVERYYDEKENTTPNNIYAIIFKYSFKYVFRSAIGTFSILSINSKIL